LLLIAASRAFPATQKSTFYIPASLSVSIVYNTTIDVTSNIPIVYIPLLNTDQVTANHYKVNMSTASGTMLNWAVYSLPQAGLNPVVSLSASQGYYSYQTSFGAQYATFTKSTIAQTGGFVNTTNSRRGLYLSNYGLFILN
jgi:hypothetical protein